MIEEVFALEHYNHDLTQLTHKRAFPFLTGYEGVIARIFEILVRKNQIRSKYNPLVVDSDKVLKLHIILEVIRRVAMGNAPESLSTLQIISPNFPALCGTSPLELPPVTENEQEREGKLVSLLSWPVSNAWDSSDVVSPRFQALLSAVRKADRPVLLIFPDIHRFVGGGPHPYPIDLAPLLAPALARHEMQLLGTSPLAEYRQYVERDAALQRRIQEIVPRSDEELQQSQRLPG